MEMSSMTVVLTTYILTIIISFLIAIIVRMIVIFIHKYSKDVPETKIIQNSGNQISDDAEIALAVAVAKNISRKI